MTPVSLARPAVLEAGAQTGLRTSSVLSAARNDARSQAEAFEASFLSTMFENMFTGVGDEGPLGNAGAGMWRSFLTEAYAKQIAKTGGVGIADQVYSTLLAHQEANSGPRTGATAP